VGFYQIRSHTIFSSHFSREAVGEASTFGSIDREKSFLMEQVSRKDQQKAEGGPDKRRSSVTFAGWLTLFPDGNAHFPPSRMNGVLLNGENGTKKW
jgi:hypothetical protein